MLLKAKRCGLTLCRIGFSEEVKIAIEIGHIIVFQNIASYAQFKKGRSRSEGGKTHRRDAKIKKIKMSDCVLDA